MMNKKQKGFSLAELLISLLIISIVLSAAIPTITKKNGASRENIWRWSDQNNSIYATMGSNQAALLGLDRIPDTDSTKLVIDDATAPTDPDENITLTESWTAPEANKIKFSNKGDKFVILKRKAYQDEPATLSSHISFYNTVIKNTGEAEFNYAGRISMDPGNIAIGIGSLQNQNPESTTIFGENTAIGHLALTNNYDGKRNTALGRKTLTKNIHGHNNTAIGFGTLYDLGYDDSKTPVNNTAIGALSQRYNIEGRDNTAVGYGSLYNNKTGDKNTAIGSASLSELTSGKGNTAVGQWSCGLVTEGKGNVCIGYGAGFETGPMSGSTLTKNYGLYIGVPKMVGEDEYFEPSIITGHMKYESGVDKELTINAKRVAFRPFNGSANIFEFLSLSGVTGYEEQDASHEKGRFGIANFNLRDVGGIISNYNEASTTLQFSAPYPNRTAYIQSFDRYNTSSTDTYYNDINFNNMLTLDFPKEVWQWGSKIDNQAIVAIRAESPKGDGSEQGNNYPLLINDMITVNPSAKEIILSTDSNKNAVKINDFSSPTRREVRIGEDFDFYAGENNNNPYTIKYGLFFKANELFAVHATSTLPSTVPAHTSRILFNNLTIVDNNDVQIDVKGDINVRGTANIFDGNANGSLKNSLQAIKDALTEIRQQIQQLATASDIRLKNVSGDNTAGLKEINALQVKNFTYKKDEKKTPHVGVIAQELQKIFPNAVSKDEDGYLRIRTEDIFYAMVNSIKELCKQIQDLTAKITGLDKRITALEQQNKQLKEQNKAFEKRLAKLEKQAAQKK